MFFIFLFDIIFDIFEVALYYSNIWIFKYYLIMIFIHCKKDSHFIIYEGMRHIIYYADIRQLSIYIISFIFIFIIYGLL